MNDLFQSGKTWAERRRFLYESLSRRVSAVAAYIEAVRMCKTNMPEFMVAIVLNHALDEIENGLPKEVRKQYREMVKLDHQIDEIGDRIGEFYFDLDNDSFNPPKKIENLKRKMERLIERYRNLSSDPDVFLLLALRQTNGMLLEMNQWVRKIADAKKPRQALVRAIYEYQLTLPRYQPAFADDLPDTPHRLHVRDIVDVYWTAFGAAVILKDQAYTKLTDAVDTGATDHESDSLGVHQWRAPYILLQQSNQIQEVIEHEFVHLLTAQAIHSSFPVQVTADIMYQVVRGQDPESRIFGKSKSSQEILEYLRPRLRRGYLLDGMQDELVADIPRLCSVAMWIEKAQNGQAKSVPPDYRKVDYFTTAGGDWREVMPFLKAAHKYAKDNPDLVGKESLRLLEQASIRSKRELIELQQRWVGCYLTLLPAIRQEPALNHVFQALALVLPPSRMRHMARFFRYMRDDQ